MAPAATASLVEGLRRPEAYPPPRPGRVDVVTTHISWVFLTDREVFKVKRPVDYGFVDYTTPERRRHFCEEEVRLNRRLAPDVYLGVVPVREGPGGPGLTGEGPVVDYAVHMRRLPEAASAEARLRAGTLTHDQLWAVAATLARFYESVPAAPEFGQPEVLQVSVEENFAQVRDLVGELLPATTFEAVRAWQLAWLRERADRFRARAAHGRVRDGHGDLRLEHVYFEDGRVLVLDCVEFNERFRKVDVAADVTFLAMELDARGRGDLAASFLGRFALEANDYELYSVRDFYLSYRAWVRAKVAAFLARDPATPPDRAARKAEEARRLFALAECYTRPPAAPGPVVVVGGLIGTGKTALAEALARRLGLPVVSSDRTRKWLAGVPAGERAPHWAYGPALSRRTFDELFRRAEVVLDTGSGVILDATFRARALRGRARELARRHGRRFLFVETTCDEATVRERLRQRAAGPTVSDATEALLADFQAGFEPVTEFPPADHLQLATTAPPDALARVVVEVLAGAEAGA